MIQHHKSKYLLVPMFGYCNYFCKKWAEILAVFLLKMGTVIHSQNNHQIIFKEIANIKWPKGRIGQKW
jgi:hypothetical protein